MSQNGKLPVTELIGRDSQGRSLHLGEIGYSSVHVTNVGGTVVLRSRDADGVEHLTQPIDGSHPPTEAALSTKKSSLEANPTVLLTQDEAARLVLHKLIEAGYIPRPVQDGPRWDKQSIDDAVPRLKRADSK